MSSLAIFILTTFNVLISFFIMRVWCQYLRVSTNNVVARSILLVTRIPVAMLGNKVSRGINLSACGAVLILTIAKLLTEYYVLFDIKAMYVYHKDERNCFNHRMYRGCNSFMVRSKSDQVHEFKSADADLPSDEKVYTSNRHG